MSLAIMDGGASWLPSGRRICCKLSSPVQLFFLLLTDTTTQHPVSFFFYYFLSFFGARKDRDMDRMVMQKLHGETGNSLIIQLEHPQPDASGRGSSLAFIIKRS